MAIEKLEYRVESDSALPFAILGYFNQIIDKVNEIVEKVNATD
jgi:hypothetical protein